MKILSTLFLGSLMLLGGCQPREAGRTAPEPQPEQQTETPAGTGGGNARAGPASLPHRLHGRH